MNNENQHSPLNKKTYYHLILDRSGSMSDCWNETMSGLHNQFQKIRTLQEQNPDQEIFVSLCIFDNVIEFPIAVIPARFANFQQVLHHIHPRSNTALFDAVGDSIRHMEFHAGADLERNEASVIVVVLTDGQENASTRYSAAMIRREIQRLEANGLWTFSFIGADFDITRTAESFQAGAHSAMNFSKANIDMAFETMNDKMHDYMEMKKQGFVKKEFLN
jgi:hypothetical protein